MGRTPFTDKTFNTLIQRIMKLASLQIFALNELLCIVADPKQDTFKPFVMKNGQLYDTALFRPIDPKPKQKSLTDDQRAQAKQLLAEARKAWDEMAASKPAPAPVQEAPAQPAPAPAPAQPKTPQTTLDTLIAESVAKLSVGSVMETAKPMLDKYIADTYGVLPKTVKVETPFGQHEVKGLTGQEFEDVLKLVTADIPVFLSGPAGCGKNVMCKQVAQALGLNFYFSNAVTEEYKMTGFIDANGVYHETEFFKAFTQGGVFMLDEIDASSPEVLVLLNAAIANKYQNFPTGKYEAHKDFRLIAAGNTYGTGADSEYTGRFQLDASSLDRFAILDVTYDKKIEESLAGGDQDLLKFVWEFRKSVKKSNINFTVSYRAIDRLAKMVAMFDIQKAVKLAILRGMEKEDAKMVANNMYCNNKYADALRAIVY